MHYFQFLLIFRLNQSWLGLPPHAQAKKARKSRRQANTACLRDPIRTLYIPSARYSAAYTMPCPSIASTTFSNPAILAPAT